MYQLTESAGMPKAGVAITGGSAPEGRALGVGMEFSCTARQVAGRVVLTVAGDVDLAAHTRFEADVDHSWTGSSDLVVDCSQVTFLDSMGLRVLVRTMQRVAGEGRAFALAAPSEPVLRVLDLAGVKDLFSVVGPVPNPEPDPDPA